MKRIKVISFVTFLIAAIAAIMSVAWTPMTSSVPIEIRNQVTDLQNAVDMKTYATMQEDFFILDTARWDTTSVVATDGGCSVAAVDSAIAGAKGGILKITLNNHRGEGMNIQSTNAPFFLTRASKPDSAGVPIDFECKFLVNNATQSTIFCGLTIEDEALNVTQSNGLYFIKHDNSTTMYAKERNSTEATADTTTCGSISNRTWYRAKISWNGKKADFYLNDVKKASLTTAANQPVGVNLKPTFEVVVGDSVASYAYLDYLLVKQKR